MTGGSVGVGVAAGGVTGAALWTGAVAAMLSDASDAVRAVRTVRSLRASRSR